MIVYNSKTTSNASLFLGFVCICISNVYAQLPDGARLTIGPGSTYSFAFSLPAPLFEGHDGLVLGTIAPAVPGSFHVGLLDGNPGEMGGIVQSFEFGGSTATFWTEFPVVDLGGGLIDMSGWRGAWGNEPFFSFDNSMGFLTVTGNTYVESAQKR